jgi:hypothetical protein
VGFLDRAKKLAEQAMTLAEDAVSEAKAKADARKTESGGSGGAGTSSSGGDPAFGTPYVEGMLGREGWRERGLPDPAAVLPIDDRDRAGIPRSTRSEIVEEAFGMGRRWTGGRAAVGLFHRVHAEHQSWQPPSTTEPLAGVERAVRATLDDGRTLVLIGEGQGGVVLESKGLDESAVATLARAAAEHLDG